MTHRLLDEDGQPPPQLYSDRVSDRLVAEMLGLARGVLADGAVNEAEVRAFRSWMEMNPDAAVGFPGDLIAERLREIFEDGVIDEDERSDLAQLLADLAGGPGAAERQWDRYMRLALNKPTPDLFFDGWEYVFTGRFAYGARKRCMQAVTDRGGRAAPSLSRHTDVLVIGTFGSAAWVQSTYGLKILNAMDMRAEGHEIRIVAEEHWVGCLEYC